MGREPHVLKHWGALEHPIVLSSARMSETDWPSTVGVHRPSNPARGRQRLQSVRRTGCTAAKKEFAHMSWLIPYCVLVLGGLAYCLIHDSWLDRHDPQKTRDNTYYGSRLRQKSRRPFVGVLVVRVIDLHRVPGIRPGVTRSRTGADRIDGSDLRGRR